METTTSTPQRSFSQKFLNLSPNSDRRQFINSSQSHPFESMHQLHTMRKLETELKDLKQAFAKLQAEKQTVEIEAKKEQELYLVTIGQLKAVISSLDKEKETLEDQLVCEYEVSENSIMETELKLQELQELYEDSQENWEREKKAMQNTILQQDAQISELKKGKIELESFNSKCQEKVAKLKGRVYELTEEVKNLKSLLNLHGDLGYREQRSNSTIKKNSGAYDRPTSPVSDNSTAALESPTPRSPTRSIVLSPLSPQFIAMLKKELTSTERLARRNRVKSVHKASFNLPGNLMKLIEKPKRDNN
jgi:chromosome segregation ATPase